MNAPAPAPLVRPRRTAALFGLTGLLFLLYPVLRPWADETTLDGARAMASGQWIAAHMSAVIGFIVLSLAAGGVRDLLIGTRAARTAAAAVTATWIGAGLTIVYYGAEIFGVHEMASRAVAARDAGMLDMVEGFRFQPVAVSVFALGLVLLGAGAVLLAAAVARSGLLPRWSGAAVAAGFALFIPQFFAGAPVRIAHGVLIAAGAAWLAASLWRTRVSGPARVR